MIALAVFAALLPAPLPAGDAAGAFEARTGVRLILDTEGGSTDGVRVEPLDPRAAGRALQLADRLAAAWPRELLAGSVDEVRFVGGVGPAAAALGGLARCETRTLFVRLDGRVLDAGVLRTMHHEVGHLVHCQLALDEVAWTAGQRVRYAGGLGDWSRYAARHHHELAADPSLATPYAAASLEEDVAETFALAIGSPAALPEVLRVKPGLVRKLELLEDAVQARWPAFSFDLPASVAAR